MQTPPSIRRWGHTCSVVGASLICFGGFGADPAYVAQVPALHLPTVVCVHLSPIIRDLGSCLQSSCVERPNARRLRKQGAEYLHPRSNPRIMLTVDSIHLRCCRPVAPRTSSQHTCHLTRAHTVLPTHAQKRQANEHITHALASLILLLP